VSTFTIEKDLAFWFWIREDGVKINATSMDCIIKRAGHSIEHGTKLTVTITDGHVEVGLRPSEILACMDRIEYLGPREHVRWSKGAFLWIKRAMVFGVVDANEWAGSLAHAERRGAESMSSIVIESRDQ
jgi:hypothetical protein